jgi:hypothetical protein
MEIKYIIIGVVCLAMIPVLKDEVCNLAGVSVSYPRLWWWIKK